MESAAGATGSATTCAPIGKTRRTAAIRIRAGPAWRRAGHGRGSAPALAAPGRHASRGAGPLAAGMANGPAAGVAHRNGAPRRGPTLAARHGRLPGGSSRAKGRPNRWPERRPGGGRRSTGRRSGTAGQPRPSRRHHAPAGCPGGSNRAEGRPDRWPERRLSGGRRSTGRRSGTAGQPRPGCGPGPGSAGRLGSQCGRC